MVAPVTAAETRARLIEATAKLLDSTPTGEITTKAVLEASGVSHGSMYHQFADLQDLIDAAMLHRLSAATIADIAQAEALLEVISTPEEAIEALLSIHAMQVSAMRAKIRKERTRIIGRAIDRPELREAVSEDLASLIGAMEVVVTDWKNKGWLADGLDVKAVATFIYSYTFGKVTDDIQPVPIPAEDWLAVVRAAISSILVTGTR